MLKPVLNASDELREAYCVGGPVAISAQGIARATSEVDMVSNHNRPCVLHLVEILESNYCVDKEIILEAHEW